MTGQVLKKRVFVPSSQRAQRSIYHAPPHNPKQNAATQQHEAQHHLLLFAHAATCSRTSATHLTIVCIILCQLETFSVLVLSTDHITTSTITTTTFNYTLWDASMALPPPASCYLDSWLVR